MDRLNRTSINMLSSLLGYAIPMVINLVSTPLLLDAVGETAFGLQSLVAVIIGYLTVMDMGLDLPITKYLAEDHARNDTASANKMLNNTLQLYLIIGFIGMTVIILFAKILSENVFKVPADMSSQAVIVFQLAGIGFLGSVGMSWGRAVSMGLQRFEITYGVAIITNLAGIGFGLLLVYLGYGVVGFVLMRVLSTVCAGIAYWMIARILLPAYRFKPGFDFPTIRRLRSYIGYGVINRGLSAIVSRLDQTLIGIWLGVAAAGIYSIPFMIVNSLSYMIAYMLGFTFPMASELHSTDQHEKLKDIYIRSTRFITVLSCMIFIPMFVFGNSFMLIWVGKTVSSQTKTVLMLLTASFFLSTLFVALPNNIAVGTGRIRQFTVYCMFRAVVLGLSCLVFIKPFGLNGAGFALILTNAVDLVFLIIVLKRFLKLSPYALFLSAYYPPLVLGIILAIVSFFIRPISCSWVGLIVAIGLFDIIYLVISFKINIFGEAEKLVIKNIFSIARRISHTD
jgi:O-antigen/teichoic acid export membrane protein